MCIKHICIYLPALWPYLLIYYLLACSKGRRKFGGLPRLPLDREPVTSPGRDRLKQLVPWPVPCHFSTITRVLVAEIIHGGVGWVTWTFLRKWMVSLLGQWVDVAWWESLDIQPSVGSWNLIMLHLQFKLTAFWWGVRGVPWETTTKACLRLEWFC